MATQWRSDQWKAPFFTIWTGQALSLTGSRIAMFALIWWLTQETGSATVLAMATLFALLPYIVLGPVVGVYVDRWNRRVTMIVADSLIALASLGLAYLFWSGRVEVWHVYAILLFRELGGIFHWPAMQSSTSLMVPQEHLARVSGLNQAMMGALNIVGPALGAVLLSLAEMPSIMLLDVFTALLATTPLFLIAIPQPERKVNGEGEKASFTAELREGLRYLLNWRGLAMITLGAMIFKIALTPVFSLLPLLVTDHFDGQAGDLATLESAFGIGIILGGLLLSVCGGFRREGYFGLSSILMQAPILITLGLLPPDTFPIAVGLLLIMGGTVATAEGLLFSMLQKNVAPDMQGRIFMLFGSLSGLATPIGLLLAGPVSDALGVQVWYIVAGILVGGFAIWGLLTPEMVDLRRGRTPQPVSVPVEDALSAPHPASQEAAGG